MKQESMEQESISGNKNKFVFIFLFFLFAIGILFVSLEQPVEIISANKKVLNWACWIALYFIAQFAVAIFIGRVIRGSNESE